MSVLWGARRERHGVCTMSRLYALRISLSTALLVSGNHFLVCILAALQTRNFSILRGIGKLACYLLLPLLHHFHGRERLPLGRLQKGSALWALFFRRVAFRLETFFIASTFPWEEQLDPSPGPCLPFPRIQGLETVCAVSASLPTYRSRLGQGCAILKVIWLRVQLKCSDMAINNFFIPI